MLRSSSFLLRLASPSKSRPFQRIVECSILPNAAEILLSDFEATFKSKLATTSDPTQFLHNYVENKQELVPYTTTMMRVFTDLGALEDMRLIFAMAINEIDSEVPEELYRIYLFSISETDTFTRDEIMNVLSLAKNTGVKLSIISKLCVLDLLLKLGLDPIEYIGPIASEYHETIPEHDIELLLKKCDSLLNTVLLTHYNAHWAAEMFNLCIKFQIAVSERIVDKLFKLCLAEPSLHPIHVIKAAWIILTNGKGTKRQGTHLNITDSDITKIIASCRRWRSLEALNSLQTLLVAHGRYDDNNVSLHRSFAVACMHVLSETGRATEAIKLLPLLEGQSLSLSHSPYPFIENDIVVAETHPTYFISNTLAQQGVSAIDAAYYSLSELASSCVNNVSESGEESEENEIASCTRTLTTSMMDVVVAACAAVKDEIRALETFNEYPSLRIRYSSDSFLHVMSSIANIEDAVRWHRPGIALAIAHDVAPSMELLRLMLSQSLEVNDIDNALWVVKLNRIFHRPVDRTASLKLCSKITSARDAEAAAFFIKVLEETNSNLDPRVKDRLRDSFTDLKI